MTWRDRAKCRTQQTPTNMFFPESNGNSTHQQAEAAIRYCRGDRDGFPCPSTDACWAYAQETRVGAGVWGGHHILQRNLQVQPASSVLGNERLKVSPEPAAEASWLCRVCGRVVVWKDRRVRGSSEAAWRHRDGRVKHLVVPPVSGAGVVVCGRCGGLVSEHEEPWYGCVA